MENQIILHYEDKNLFLVSGYIESKPMADGGRIESIRGDKDGGFVEISQTPKEKTKKEDGKWEYGKAQIWDKKRKISVRFWSNENKKFEADKLKKELLGDQEKVKVLALVQGTSWYDKDKKQGGNNLTLKYIVPFYSQHAAELMKKIAKELLRDADFIEGTLNKHHERGTKGEPQNTPEQIQQELNDDLPF